MLLSGMWGVVVVGVFVMLMGRVVCRIVLLDYIMPEIYAAIKIKNMN